MKLMKLFLKKSKLVLLISVIIIFAGIFAYSSIPKQKKPDIAPPMGSYQLMAPGFSAQEMQEYIIEPIETIIYSIDSEVDINATAFDNFALITIFLDVRESNADEKWEEITTEISLLDLPEQVLPPVFQNKFGFPHAVYSIESDKMTQHEVEDTAKDFADKLRELDEISSVDILGMTEQQLEISIDMDIFNELPLTVQTVSNILFANGLNIPVGNLLTNDSSISIEVPMHYFNIDEIKETIVGKNVKTGEPIYLQNVAEISVKEINDTKSLYVNGNEAIFVSVYFEDNLDITKLGDKLNDKVNQFSKDYSSYNIDTMVFQPDSVNESMDVVNKSLLQGLLFVLIVIIIGLGLRNAISIAFTFPLIIFATVLGLTISGQQLQMISITGLIISIGIIVDNSIVISESIQHNLNKGLKKKEAIIQSVKKNSSPVLASTLTTIAAFIPLLLMPGSTGKLMFALPFTVIIAILLSYVVSMLVSPIIAAILFKPKKKRFKFSYKKALNKAMKFSLKRPKTIIIISFVLLFASLFAVVNLQPLTLFPSSEESVLYINYEYTKSVDPTDINNYVLDIIDVINDNPQIDYLAYSVGGDLPRFDSSLQVLDELPNVGRIYVSFDIPYEELEPIKEDIINKLDYYLEDGIISVNEMLLVPSFSGVEVSISSTDFEQVILATKELEIETNNIKDIKSININYPTYHDKYIVELDRKKLSKYGMVAVDVQNQIRNIIGTTDSGDYSYEGNNIQIALKTNIMSLRDFRNIGILSKMSNSKVPLYKLGDINTKESIYSLSTFNGDYQLKMVIMPESDEYTSKIQSDVEAVVDTLDYDNVAFNYGGEKEMKSDSFTALAQAAIIAIILIYLIMLAQFNSFKQPLIVLSTIPLSLIGASMAAILFNTPITFTVVLGFISLMGIVVNSGILLIDYINTARREGKSLKKACYKSVERRIRPITLSSVTTILGLIPLALYGGAFFSPMAVTLMGGLTMSTLLTIFVIPSAYYLFEKKNEQKPTTKKQLKKSKQLE